MMVNNLNKYKLIDQRLDDVIQYLKNETSEEYEIKISSYDDTDDNNWHKDTGEKPIITLFHRDNIVKRVRIS